MFSVCHLVGIHVSNSGNAELIFPTLTRTILNFCKLRLAENQKSLLSLLKDTILFRMVDLVPTLTSELQNCQV